MDNWQKRIQDLEAIEQEYKQVKALIEEAASGVNLEKYTGDMLLYLDPATGLIVDANDLALDYLGYRLEEIRTINIAALESRDNEETTIYNKRGNPIEIYACHYRHHDGFELPTTVRKRLIKKAGKDLWHYILEDKSLRKQVWRELNRREDTDYQFREQLKTLNEIILDLGRISSVDDLCRRSIELGLERLAFDRISIWLMDSSEKLMRGTFGVDEVGQIRDERGQSWSYVRSYVEDFLAGKHQPIVMHDDAPLYNERSELVGYGWHISAPLLDGAEFIGFMGVDNFIHKRPLKSYQTDLIQLFGANVGHLISRQFKQQKALELQVEQERLRFLGNFVTNIGHEFKTPLTIIKTSNYFLGKTQDESKRQSHVTKIDDSVSYLNYLLNLMLEMVRLDSQPELKMKSLQLDRFLSDIANSLLPLAESKQLQWQIEVQAGKQVQADSELLSRAIEEIIKNAIDYTPAHGKIQISLTEGENQIQIIVQDTGIGIPMDELEQIFERFYRVDKARSSRNAGLGLAIAKRIIELHRGEIHVKSILGAGARFEIRLPF